MLPNLKILFLCTGNSCRSQMAEGWAQKIHGDRLEPYSAGTRLSRVDPRAVDVMREAGVDISAHRSKHVNESCPVFPGNVKRLHVGFDDPPGLAADASSEGEALGHYRRIRDEIRTFIEDLPRRLALSQQLDNGSKHESEEGGEQR